MRRTERVALQLAPIYSTHLVWKSKQNHEHLMRNDRSRAHTTAMTTALPCPGKRYRRVRRDEGEGCRRGDSAIKVTNAATAGAAAIVIAGLLTTTKRFWRDGCPVKESLDHARLLGPDVPSSSGLKPPLTLSEGSSKEQETCGRQSSTPAAHLSGSELRQSPAGFRVGTRSWGLAPALSCIAAPGTSTMLQKKLWSDALVTLIARNLKLNCAASAKSEAQLCWC